MGDIKTRDFVAIYTPDCRKRHTHSHLKGKIISFRVQLEVYYKGRWYPVIRYDTAHGFAHRDYLRPDGKVEKTPLFTQDYNEALTFAEKDLNMNWESCRQRFLKEVKGSD